MSAPTATWKAFERAVARVFGGTRRGAHTSTGGAGSGLSDVIHDHWAIECKLLCAPSYSQIVAACRQAEAAAEDFQEPVSVIKRKNARLKDEIVCMRLETFIEWRLGNGE